MEKLITILVAAACAVASTTVAASYSTEATMTRQKDKYEVVVRVSHLVERDGKIIEELISQPKLTSSPGVPASLNTGFPPSNPNYTRSENVNVDVSWPEVGKRDFAMCTVTIKLGDKIVSKTKTRVMVEEK